MKRLIWILLLLLICALAPQAAAAELEAPQVPQSGAGDMPQHTDSLFQGLLELLQRGLMQLRPELKEAARASLSLAAVVMMVGLLRTFPGGIQRIGDLAGAAAVAWVLLRDTNSMISLGAETVRELSEYGKLLCPVMTAALAAQGGTTASAALYAGTAAFDAILSGLIAGALLPMVYVFLALAVANSALGADALKTMRDLIKNFVSWCLKILLTVFTTYMGITGVVSGSTDAVTLKAARVTISSVVPVVGGILSDASEAVLVSVGVAKSAAGIYGILAVLAVFLNPFVTIGVQYLTLKITAGICGVFGAKSVTGLIEDFSSAMGLILAMTGSACLLVLISTICFLKGVG